MNKQQAQELDAQITREIAEAKYLKDLTNPLIDEDMLAFMHIPPAPVASYCSSQQYLPNKAHCGSCNFCNVLI